jgi:nucleotidyltransferase substrate binding protein (TIGR01987 family)
MTKVRRWQQRFAHFNNAFERLNDALARIAPAHKDSSDELVLAGFIQTYAFTMELGWKTMKDYLFEQGYNPGGSKEVMKQAFQDGLIPNGRVWMDAIDDRNLIAHIYDRAAIEGVIKKVRESYIGMLKDLSIFFESKHDQ